MRFLSLPLVLAGLLGSAGLAPAAAFAYPNAGPRYNYNSYGPVPSPTYAPLPVRPYGYNNAYGSYSNNAGVYPNGYRYPIVSKPTPYAPAPGRICNRGTVLTGAAIGGGLGAILATNSRNRLWSLPIGAAMGGILGGVISGC